MPPFVRFLAVAGQINGQVLNSQNISRDAAVARSTVDTYCDVGETLDNYNAQDPNRNLQQELIYEQLNSICNCVLTDDNAETLRTRLRDPTRLYNRLFTFLKYPQVQPTNNQANSPCAIW